MTIARCLRTAILSLTTLFVFATAPALAADYYVAPDGSDSNAGTSASPWKTLQKAANTVRAGDVVRVQPGVYRGFQIRTSGTAANPITFVTTGPGVLVNQQNSSTPDNINVEGADHVIIDGFEVEDAPRVGIRAVIATGVIIRNNTVRRSGLTGILTGWTPSVLIENNSASGSLDQHGIYVSNSDTPSDNAVVRGNDCFGNNQNGIQFNGDCWEGGDGVIEGAVIEGNFVHDNNWKGLSIISVQASTIRNNVIHNNGIEAGAGGIHLTDQVGPSCGKPSSSNIVVNNTVVEPRMACIRMTNGSTDNIIFNNLCVASSSSKFIVDEVGGNLIDSASNLNRTSAGSMFVDASGRDFHLSSGSAAIDAGAAGYQSVPAPASDRDGGVRPVGAGHDAGAYEAGSDPPTGDVTPPVATITTPGNNSAVSRVTTIAADATDNVGVVSVEFLLDGGALGPADTAAPYTGSLDPAAHATGFYTLSARARDAAGNVGASPPVSVFIQSGEVRGSIPTTHPRLMLLDGRLAELQALACYDANGTRLSGCTPSAFAASFFDLVDQTPGTAEPWHFALAYAVTRRASYADQAIAMVDQQVGCDYPCVADAGDAFLHVADFLRNAALVYDWCFDRLTDQQRAAWMGYMNKLLFVTWNATPEANAIYDTQDVGTANGRSHHLYAYLLATAYVSLATFGENPETFTHAGTTRQLYLLATSSDAGSARYYDPFAFVLAKLDDLALPALDSHGDGGGWTGGEEAGRDAKRFLFEALTLLKETAGVDYLNDVAHPFARHAVRYQLHTLQPGDDVLYPGGDAIHDPTLAVDSRDRQIMLLLAGGLSGAVEAQYAQYWLNRGATPTGGGVAMAPVDFLLYRPGLPERTYEDLPPRYAAAGIGWINSRSDWSPDAVSVSFTSTDRVESAQHADQNHFTIYAGGADTPLSGWLVTDTQPFGSGPARASLLHNTVVVGGGSQRFGQGTGALIRRELDRPGHVYALGDASDAYWSNAGDTGTGDERMVGVFHRELVHILPGYVVVFDRVSMTGSFAGTRVIDAFHYPAAKPAQSGDAWVSTSDGNRLFHRVVMPESPSIVWVDENTGTASERMRTWRMELGDVTQPNYQFLNVFYSTTSSVSDMPVTARIASEDGGMVGVAIKDPAQEHVVMFSADPNGAPPANINYQVGSNVRGIQRLFDLVPGLGYAISVTPRNHGYSIAVREGGTFIASDAGSLVFTPEDVLAPAVPVASK